MADNLRETDLYKQMTPYAACELAEGFGAGEDADDDDRLVAWQYISDTGLWRQLQGFYGRAVYDLISSGEILAPNA